MPACDIEYPLQDDVVGPTFTAGGTYADDSHGTNLPAGAKVVCKLFTNSGDFEAEDDLEDAPSSGTWEVTFTLNVASDYDNCTVQATFYNGNGSQSNPATSGTFVVRAAAGDSIKVK